MVYYTQKQKSVMCFIRTGDVFLALGILNWKIGQN